MTVIGLWQIYFLWQYLCGLSLISLLLRDTKSRTVKHGTGLTANLHMSAAPKWSILVSRFNELIRIQWTAKNIRPVAKITRLSLQNPLSNHNSHPYNHLHLVHMFILWCWTMVGLCQCLKQRESRLTIYHRVQTTNIVLRWYPIRSWLLRSYKNIETKTSHYKLYCYMFL